MASEAKTCPTCGTVQITFDPPLYFEAEDSCGLETNVDIIVDATVIHKTEKCVNSKNHNGKHYFLVEEVIVSD